MPNDRRDYKLYLLDIFSSCKKIIRYTAKIDHVAFANNSMIIDAVVRNLEIIGEAVNKIPPQIRKDTNELPWRDIVGSRQLKLSGGFTLMEILISVGVLAVVSTLIAQVLFTTTRVNKKVTTLSDVKSSGEFALGVVERLIRSAIAMETVCDTGAETTPSARLLGAGATTTTITCMSDGTAARIASVSATGAISYLTDNSVTLNVTGTADCADSSLLFSCPASSGPSAVTINFSLGQIGEGGGKFETARSSFQSSVSLRN